MKTTLLTITALSCLSLSSCGLATGLLGIPVGLLNVAGSAANLATLSDQAPAPVTDLKEESPAQ